MASIFLEISSVLDVIIIDSLHSVYSWKEECSIYLYNRAYVHVALIEILNLHRMTQKMCYMMTRIKVF